ncbi:MAG: Flp pilus assembly protein CpaB [Planctomycetes bacterium]|nr:Flp pilus assembly protein CpaB [Planctomycetota bacterium]
MKTRLALAAAILLGVLAALGLRVYMVNLSQESGARQQSAITVLAARRALPKGQPLAGGEEDLESRTVPENLVGPNHVLPHQQHRLAGMRPVVNIERGEVLLWTYFVSPTEIHDEVGERLREGERAVSVKVDQISGVAGLILPNSRVDVLGTFAEPDQGGRRGGGHYTRPLLYNVPVLAIDNQVSLLGIQSDQRARQGGYSSVTLAVNPAAARLLIFAQAHGQISLVLRRPADTGIESATEVLTPENLDAVADRLIQEQRDAARSGQPEKGP